MSLLFPILIIVFYAGFAALCYRRLEWAIYLVLLALPTYLIRFSISNLPSTLLEGMILVLFVVWLIRPGTEKNLVFKKLKIFVAPLGVLLLAATVSVWAAPQFYPALGIWKAYFIEPVLFFIVFVDVIRTERTVRTALWCLGASLIIPGVFAIFQKFTGAYIPNEFWQAAATRRVTSFYGYPNAIGLYFAPLVALLAGMWLGGRKQHDQLRNWLLIIMIAVGGLSIIFAQSKGAVLAVGGSLLFYALIWKNQRRLVSAVLVAGVIAALLAFPQILSLQGSKTVAGGGSLEVRTDQWSEAWAMLKTRPIAGAGLSGYQERVKPFHDQEHIEIYMYPHQIFLNFWSETGLLGLIAFMWLVAVFYKQVWQLRHNSAASAMALPLGGAMTALLVHGLVDVPYFKNDLSVLFWALMAALTAAAWIARNHVTPLYDHRD